MHIIIRDEIAAHGVIGRRPPISDADAGIKASVYLIVLDPQASGVTRHDRDCAPVVFRHRGDIIIRDRLVRHDLPLVGRIVWNMIVHGEELYEFSSREPAAGNMLKYISDREIMRCPIKEMQTEGDNDTDGDASD